MSLAGRESLGAARGRRSAPLALLLAWAPVLIWGAFIFSLSGDQFSDDNTAAWLSGIVDALGISPALIGALNVIVRKCAHFVEYAVLGGLMARAMRETWPRRSMRQILLATVLLTAACASLDELRQQYGTTRREGSWRDSALDTAGAAVGGALGLAYLGTTRRRRSA